MKMSKRSRKLVLSAGMLAAVATIPPAPPAEAACRLECPNGQVWTCTNPNCHVHDDNGYLWMGCGRAIYDC